MLYKVLLLFITIKSILTELFHGPYHPTRDILKMHLNSSPEKAFKIWHYLHKRDYEIDSDIGKKKFEIFKKNFEIINKHNSKTERSYTLALNHFADMTLGEFHQKYLFKNKEYFHSIVDSNSPNNINRMNIINKNKDNKNLNKEEFYSLFWNLPDDEEENIKSNNNNQHLKFLDSNINLQSEEGNLHALKNNGYKKNTTEYISINWILQGSLNKYVEDQGECGSCWAFSAVQSIQAAYTIKTGKIEKFSKQQLVDCDMKSSACNGGFPHYAMKYIKKNGLMKEQDYPYKENMTETYTKNCIFDKINENKDKNILQIKDFEYCFDKEKCKNDEDFFEMLKKGPVSAVVDASEEFMLYDEGIYDKPCSEKNHAILVVGYHRKSNENEDSYWIVKNSWGYLWGDHGYIKIKHSNNYNSCLLNQYYLRPILE